MFHLRFGLSDHLKALLDFVFGSRRRVKKVRIFRAWFSHGSGAIPALETFGRKPFSSLIFFFFALCCLGKIPGGTPFSQLHKSGFFLLYAAWVRSRAERPSVSYTKVVMEVAWTGHNLQFTKTN